MLIGITTSPRPKSYLIETIKSIQAAATTTPASIIVSPNFIDPTEDWPTVNALSVEVLSPLVARTLDEHNADLGLSCDRYAAEYTHRGLQHNADRLMFELVNRNDPWFVTMQDDAILAPRSVDRFHQVAEFCTSRKVIGAVSFYSPWAELKMCGAISLYHWGFYGEICVLWRREVAKAFLPFSNVNEAHDLEIARFFRTYKQWRLMAHSPCLAQHVGKESARGDVGAGRTTTMNYMGLDAMRGKPLK